MGAMDESVSVDPEAVVEAYRLNEQGIRSLLRELNGQQLEGEHEAVRKRVRAFAEAEQEAFIAVTLALTSEEFHETVESTVGPEAAAEFESVGEQFQSLAETFHLVRLEATKERFNPITSIDVKTTYEADEELPIVGHSVASGDATMYEFKGSTSETLQLAGYVVQAANESLEAVLNTGRTVSTDELSRLIDRHQKLETELGEFYDHIDELRREPAGE
jgi:hypothetical protein